MVNYEDVPDEEDSPPQDCFAAVSDLPASAIPPPELRGVPTAESVRVSFERGEAPDTHRFLRMLQKLSLGLGAASKEAAAIAEKRLFAVPLWMEKIRDETGLELWIARALCALVVIFHRRGDLTSAFRLHDELRARNCEIPTCTYALLIDLSLREGRYEQAAELLDQAHSAARAFIRSAPDLKEASLRAPTLAVDGLPSWVSNRDGHLVALIAAQVVVVGCLPLLQAASDSEENDSSRETFAPPPRRTSSSRTSSVSVLATRALREGLQLLRDAEGTGASGPAVGFERRMSVAQRLLVRPCVHFVTSHASRSRSSFTGEILRDTLSSFDISSCEDCPEVEAFLSDYTAQIPEAALSVQCSPPDDREQTRALHTVLGLVRRRRKSDRAVTREDFDELLRSLGKCRASGVVLAAFEAMEVLAMQGSRPLELLYKECAARAKDVGPQAQVNEELGEASPCAADEVGEDCGDHGSVDGDGASPCTRPSSLEAQSAVDFGAESATWQPLEESPNLHLLPDADTFAAAIEGLFTARDAASAQLLYTRCCRETLPNPAVFSAVIFGCLGVQDGEGAVAALADMEDHGFAPHARFLQRFLRQAGRFHLCGLRAISQHSAGFCTAARQALFHALIEACAISASPSEDAFVVYQTMLSDSLQSNPDTYFALLRAVSGAKDEQSALSANLRLQGEKALPPHPSFECVLRECYENGERRRRAGLIMDSRRRWVHQLFKGLTDELLEDLRTAAAEAKAVMRAKPDYASSSDIFCAWLLPCYISVLPLDSAAVHAAQYVVARYYILRSGEDKAALQAELDEVIRSAYARKDAFDFVVRVVLQLRSLDTPESAQVRLVRMLSGAAWRAGARFLEAHAIFVEQRAATLLPEVLSEMMEQCGGPEAERSLYAGSSGRRQLAELVATRYLMRGHGEPIKLSVAVRFVRAHGLAHYLEDETLFNPIVAASNNSHIQFADSLCGDDMKLKCRLVAYTIGRDERRLAGRFIERLGILQAPSDVSPPANWSRESFIRECNACVSEAEDAEARELRAANAKRIAVDDDFGCLQLPATVANRLVLVDSEETLNIAAAGFADCLGTGSAGQRQLGLDVEWRPTLEKRGGMQKHRRSGQASKGEPCSTLQVACDDFAAVFDLLALATIGAPAAAAFSDFIGSLLKDSRILKLGFGLRQDILRLATSYPHLTCFRQFCSVLDVQEAWFSAARDSTSSKGASAGAVPCGLSALCSRHLGAPLSKRLQTSDWGSRPLSREQLLYAALDAHCLIGLVKALPEGSRPTQNFEVRPSASGQLMVYVESDGTSDMTAEEEIAKVDAQIASKGQEVRAMKLANAPKSAIQAEVAALLQLKDRFRELTGGVEWSPSELAATAVVATAS